MGLKGNIYKPRNERRHHCISVSIRMEPEQKSTHKLPKKIPAGLLSCWGDPGELKGVPLPPCSCALAGDGSDVPVTAANPTA